MGVEGVLVVVASGAVASVVDSADMGVVGISMEGLTSLIPAAPITAAIGTATSGYAPITSIDLKNIRG